MDIANLLVPVSIGTALLLLIDGIRWAFPQLSVKAVKAITIVLAMVLSALVYLSQSNETVQKGLEIFLIILGTSQILYGLVWKDSTIHQNIVKDGEQPMG